MNPPRNDHYNQEVDAGEFARMRDDIASLTKAQQEMNLLLQKFMSVQGITCEAARKMVEEHNRILMGDREAPGIIAKVAALTSWGKIFVGILSFISTSTAGIMIHLFVKSMWPS